MFQKKLVLALLALCVLFVSCNNIFQMLARDGDSDYTMIIGVGPVKYTVTFDINQGTGDAPESITVEADEEITLPGDDDFEFYGFVFKGWSEKAVITDDEDSEADYEAGDDYTVTANITLFAHWVSDQTTTFIITFDGNGADSGTPSPIEEFGGTIVTIPGVGDLEKYGHEFGGWNTADDGTGTTIEDGEHILIKDLKLFAVWIPENGNGNGETTYTLTFDGNGHEDGDPPEPITKNVGTPITIPGQGDLEKDGYDFIGWNTDPDGNGDEYFESEDYDKDVDATLYAQWEEV